MNSIFISLIVKNDQPKVKIRSAIKLPNENEDLFDKLDKEDIISEIYKNQAFCSKLFNNWDWQKKI